MFLVIPIERCRGKSALTHERMTEKVDAVVYVHGVSKIEEGNDVRGLMKWERLPKCASQTVSGSLRISMCTGCQSCFLKARLLILLACLSDRGVWSEAYQVLHTKQCNWWKTSSSTTKFPG